MAGQTDLSNSILLAAYPATAITLLAVSLRVYVRTCYGQIFGWDDGAQIIAVVFAIAETIAVVLSTKHGAGKHIQDILPSEDINEGLKVSVTAASIVKMAYLSSYGPSEDVLYTTVPLVKWAMVEINVANVTSSLPTLRPLFRRILEKSLSHPSKSTPNGPSHALQSLDYGAHKSVLRTTVDTRRNPNRHDSEENMIIASGGIAKTSEISVEIEEGDHSGQIRYGSRSTSPESTGVAHRPPV
ncbi:hypothetical protein RUND412_004752 [Rhizina undulata]